ncbi:DUF305 domain-containing protein [Salmonella enterica]|nr:DUF305 domain-containing protein [Salmonella enterica]
MDDGGKWPRAGCGVSRNHNPHHEGAIKIAKTQLKHGKAPEMRKLAEGIIRAQWPDADRI